MERTNRPEPPPKRSPQEVLAAATKISVGRKHRCLLDDTRHLYCWGKNWDGQLGNGRLRHEEHPTLVKGLADVVDVKAFGDTTCALTAARALYCFGRQARWLDPTLALPREPQHPWEEIEKLAPVNQPRIVARDVADFDAGYAFCFLRIDGRVFCSGSNDNGQLGNGTRDSSRPFVQVLRANGTPLEEASRVRVDGARSCAIDNRERLWCWGRNMVFDQPREYHGPPEYLYATLVPLSEPVADVAEDCIVTPSGRQLCWGWRWRGNYVPLPVGSCDLEPIALDDGCSLSRDGRLLCKLNYGWRRPMHGDFSAVELGPSAQVDTSEYLVCAVTASHGGVCWDRNTKKVIEGEPPAKWARAPSPQGTPTCPAGGEVGPRPGFPRRSFVEVTAIRQGEHFGASGMDEVKVSDEIALTKTQIAWLLELLRNPEAFEGRGRVGIHGHTSPLHFRFVDENGSVETLVVSSTTFEGQNTVMFFAYPDEHLPGPGILLTQEALADFRAFVEALGNLRPKHILPRDWRERGIEIPASSKSSGPSE